MADAVSMVVSPIVSAIIKLAGNLMRDSYLAVTGLEGDVRTLSDTLSTVQGVLEDAEKSQTKSIALKQWLEKLNDAAHAAAEELELLSAEAKQTRGLRSRAKKICFNYSMSHDIKAILGKLNSIARQKQVVNTMSNFSTTASTSGPAASTAIHEDETEASQMQYTTSLLTKSEVIGRREEISNLVEMLVSPEVNSSSIISITGMGGLGKTTLARMVYDAEDVKAKFTSYRAWVRVSMKFDLSRILREMMDCLTSLSYKPSMSSMENLHREVQTFLTGKCFLLVLDDVWSDSLNDWEPLKIILDAGDVSSKVLLTSRSTNAFGVACTRHCFSLGGMPSDECWSLFKRNAFHPDSSDSIPEAQVEIGKKIVAKCNGLPLAVQAMGRLLGHLPEDQWLDILNNEIWKVEEEKLGHEDSEILPALKLSFNHLPSHLKQCFSYCSLLPRSRDFDKLELVKLWMAVAFVQPSQIGRIEDKGLRYFNELLERSFFQLSWGTMYKIHDLMHDLAQSVSSRYFRQFKEGKEAFALTELSRHVSLNCEDINLQEITQRARRLCTLLIPGECLRGIDPSTLGQMFHRLRYIRVLDLSSSKLLDLPKSIKKLKLLQYLNLSNTEMKKLPNAVCCLFNLQTLNLRKCLSLFELPEDFSNLVNLRHLELDDVFWYRTYMRSILPPRMGRLTILHNLHTFPVGSKSGYGIEELENMVNLTGELHISKLELAIHPGKTNLQDKKRLRKLVLEWSSDANIQPRQETESADNEVLEKLKPPSEIEELRIRHFRGSRIPTWMGNHHLGNLQLLHLYHCENCRVLTLLPLPNLSQIKIKGMLKLEEWTDGLFPKLRTLKISDCPRLRELPHTFNNLQSLKIKSCSLLEVLPLTPNLMFLQLFDNLLLEYCIPNTGLHDDINSNAESMEGWRKLLELKISDCPKIVAFPLIFFPQKLEISKCESLRFLLPHHISAGRLQCLSLDTFEDDWCVHVIPNSPILYSLTISNISNLACIRRFPDLPRLHALYISGCKDLTSVLGEADEDVWQSTPALKALSVRGCPILSSSPVEDLPTTIECLTIHSCQALRSLGGPGVLKRLSSLSDLYIVDCPLIESWPEDGFPASLQHLHVRGCPSLTNRSHDVDSAEWQKLEHIPDLDIDFGDQNRPDASLPSSSTAFSCTYLPWCGGSNRT